MEEKHFYHLYANGDDAQHFITSEKEFKTAFNRFGVCQNATGVRIASFSIEDSHPHALIYGTFLQCRTFLKLFEGISLRSIVQNRGSLDGVRLKCVLSEISDSSYLMNVGTYTIVQATKDGKSVMPYDYLYGTGALYFRSSNCILPWLMDERGNVCKPVRFDTLTSREKKKLCASRYSIPDDWLICNGFILPSNYVDIPLFESIYKTHNCFRFFMCRGRKSDEEIMSRMAQTREVALEDLAARKLCEEACEKLLGRKTLKYATLEQRIRIAQLLRSSYRMAYRQLRALTYLPESELRKYVK